MKKITLSDINTAKASGKKVSMVACYDYTTARLLSATNVEMVLVGDSASQMIFGYETTLPVTMELMVALTSAVRRGGAESLSCSGYAFLSYQTSISDAVRNSGRFFSESGADIVKIEVTSAQIDVVRAVSNAGMAVMAHIGIKPQSLSKTGKYKAEGTTAETALEMVELAERMEDAGASMLLVEGAATETAKIITERSGCAVISCGSGVGCDGQVLIAPDILGLYQGRSPKFVEKFGEVGDATTKAFAKYSDAVHKGVFPDDEHSYHMKKGELERLEGMLKRN